jgi:hypothetical protein
MSVDITDEDEPVALPADYPLGSDKDADYQKSHTHAFGDSTEHMDNEQVNEQKGTVSGVKAAYMEAVESKKMEFARYRLPGHLSAKKPEKKSRSPLKTLVQSSVQSAKRMLSPGTKNISPAKQSRSMKCPEQIHDDVSGDFATMEIDSTEPAKKSTETNEVKTNMENNSTMFGSVSSLASTANNSVSAFRMFFGDLTGHFMLKLVQTNSENGLKALTKSNFNLFMYSF